MTISKRNGKYYCRFQINGERHHLLCKGADSLTKAKQIEAMYMIKIEKQQNGIVPKENIKQYKLKDLKENFLNYSKINRKVYEQDKGRINIAFQFFSENKIASEILQKDVDAFKSWLLQKGKSKKTINLYIGIFRIMYKLAIENGWIEKNPFTWKSEFKLEPRRMKYLAREAQPSLEAASPDYFLPVITTALNSALRRDNIVNLKWVDLDFTFRTIEITQNKGNKYIKIPMNDTLYDLFSSLPRVSEYVFVNPHTGTKWGKTTFTELWQDIRQKAGLGDLKFHCLRHTVCTRLVKENVPLPIIKEIMTHSDIKTTMQYTHIDSLDMVNAVNVLNSYN